MLDIIARRLNPHSDEIPAADADVQFIERERGRLGIVPDDFAISVSKFVKLDCVWQRQVILPAPGVVSSGPPLPSAYPPSLTPFGRGLLAACMMP